MPNLRSGRLITTTLLGVALLMPGGSAPAERLTIANYSFESPTLSEGSSWHDGVDGWNATPGVGTTWALPWNPSTPAAHGNQHLWAPVDAFELTQTVGTIRADARHVLMIELFPIETGTHRASVVLETAETPPVVLAAAHWHPQSDPTREDFVLAGTAWSNVRLVYDSAEGPAQVGRPMRIRLSGARLAIDFARLDIVPNPQPHPSPTTYYIDALLGNDANDGTAPDTGAWRTFGPAGALTLEPGDRVLLRRGCEWNEELRLSGHGAPGQPIELGAYGSGPRPRIMRGDTERDVAVVVEDPSHWRIRQLDCRRAKVGLYLRYTYSYHNRDVVVSDCYFEEMPSWSIDHEYWDYEVSFGSGIFLGGRIDGGDHQWTTVVEDVTIERCHMRKCSAGFNTNWFFPQPFRSRLRDVTIRDCYATRVAAGGLVTLFIDGFHVDGFRSFEPNGSSEDFIWGSTGAIVGSCVNVRVEDSAFAETDRMWHDDQAGDGSGFDIDGHNSAITLRDSVFHDNDAIGLLFLSTFGANEGVRVEDSTFYNNGLDAAVTFGGNAFEIKATENTFAGTFENLGLYRSAPSWDWIGPSIPATLTLGEIRYAWFADVGDRATAWEFATDGDDEGWGGFSADWTAPNVANGVLGGTAGGVDPSAHTAPTWLNTHLFATVRLRMSSTAGGWAQLFWITETDTDWDGAKSMWIPVEADGEMHDYRLDMNGVDSWRGVVTQLRLDPTVEDGATFAIDYLRAGEAPWVTTVTRDGDAAVLVTFNEMMMPDAEDPARYTVFGDGLGTLAAQPDTVTLVETNTYRLEWAHGAMDAGATPSVRVTGAHDIDGNATMNAGPAPPTRATNYSLFK